MVYLTFTNVVVACVWAGITGLKYGAGDYTAVAWCAAATGGFLLAAFANIMALRKK